MNSPNCRWFQYSLRTLFVVMAVVGTAMGWAWQQIKWIHERREVINDRNVVLHAVYDDDRLPWPLWLVLEDGWSQINCAADLPPHRKAQLMRLFPEANLVEGPWTWPSETTP